MENRVNSLETDLEVLKRDMTACQAGIRQEISYLKEARAELPQWLKTSAVGIIFAIFTQTIAVVWWASSIAAGQQNMYIDVAENTAFRLGWPVKHQEVMVKLKEISVDNQNMKEMLRDIKAKTMYGYKGD